MSDIAVAAILAATILFASTISVRIGLSVALIELAAGVFVGNAFDTGVPEWLSFIGSFAGIVLTFLAGAEVDVPQLRREWKSSLFLGGASFLAPFLVAMGFAYWALDWSADAAKIAGTALSTTSLAVVYAVLVETGLNRTVIGKRLMSATFVTDFGTQLRCRSCSSSRVSGSFRSQALRSCSCTWCRGSRRGSFATSAIV